MRNTSIKTYHPEPFKAVCYSEMIRPKRWPEIPQKSELEKISVLLANLPVKNLQSRPNPIKSLNNSFSYNYQEICSWTKKPLKPYWKQKNSYVFLGWSKNLFIISLVLGVCILEIYYDWFWPRITKYRILDSTNNWFKSQLIKFLHLV